jgi:GTP-binding protein
VLARGAAAAAATALRHADAPGAALRRDRLPGEEADYELRLKLLADAALVGLPNAGKSSLLRGSRTPGRRSPSTRSRRSSRARHGRLGRAPAVVADVPGLIEGASEGVGLGHEFLAHLERARLLVHVIDAAAATRPSVRRDRPRARGVRRRASPSGRRWSS